MKKIEAVIQPDKLHDVKKALFEADVCRMTVTTAIGSGQQKGYSETYRGAISEVNLLKKVKLEIVVPDAQVKKVVNAIVKGARSGKIGDGKIFVSPVESAIRIRTGEEGESIL